jgi:hypothetical protein
MLSTRRKENHPSAMMILICLLTATIATNRSYTACTGLLPVANNIRAQMTHSICCFYVLLAMFYLSIFASPLLAAKSVPPIPSHAQKFSAHNLCTTSQMHAKQRRTTHHVNINMHTKHPHQQRQALKKPFKVSPNHFQMENWQRKSLLHIQHVS